MYWNFIVELISLKRWVGIVNCQLCTVNSISPFQVNRAPGKSTTKSCQNEIVAFF